VTVKSIFIQFGVLAVFCLLFNGCGNKAAKSAFDSASPAIKACWSQALAEDQSNNYLAANTNLVSLLRDNITPEQLSAVQITLSSLNERMNNAAARGDADAQKALDTLKAMQEAARRRQVSR
jgi:hypothetical protein